MFNDKSILVTGGTGSFGKAFITKLIEFYPEVKKIIIFSRDELKQFEMAQTINTSKHKGIRYFLGDIRDAARLNRAMEGVDYVIHAAALKQVPAAEYNPFEFIKTNIIGAQNLIDACLDNGVQKLVALSTDKAASPINLYGATKLCSDKLFVAANNITGKRDLNFSIVRYGNVMGSRGSVIPFFMSKRESGKLPITDPEMTRFNISLSEGVDMVLWALENAVGGEIFVPKIPSYKITDVAKAICSKCEIEIVGIRPGEKMHEEMISATDSLNTVDIGNYYAILPPDIESIKKLYIDDRSAKPVEKGFSYNSGTNPHFLSLDELKDLFKQEFNV
jgi:UDP-N-acetylglucosamine 4,6-dehydratase/5-epimerase